MKKYIRIILSIVVILMFVGCGKKEKHEIEILIPAGSTEAFVYSETEIRPVGDKITIWSGAGLGDTEVILKPVEVKQENAYEPTYLTHGMPVKMNVEKGGWFKIGVSVQNDSDRGPIAVSVEVEGVEVRSVEKTEAAFLATILEINNQAYLVEPVVGSNELKSSDQIIVPMKNINPSPEPKVGDIIEIIYDGSIAESYPAQITNVYGIKVVEAVAEEVIVGGDLIPMVMVNGKLYFDTGTESFKIERTDHFDGEITSAVDGTKCPTKENESNFGTGYGYQHGETERTIEIYMNGKWWIFATEEVRQQKQLSSDEVCGYPTEQTLEIIESDELTDREAFLAKNLITEEEKVLTADEGQLIVDILESINWVEGAPACDNDYMITIINDTYYYHSDCGTFLDIVNNKSKSLSEEEKERVNNYIKY